MMTREPPQPTMCIDCQRAARSCPVYPRDTVWCVEFKPTDASLQGWELWLAEQAMQATEKSPQYWGALCRVAR